MSAGKLAFPFILATALAVGCKWTTEESTSDKAQDATAALALERAKAEAREAAQAIGDYAYTRRAEFVARMDKELVPIQEELDRLTGKVDSSAAAARAEARSQLEAARAEFARTKRLLGQAESATEPAWDEVRSGFKQSYANLKDSVQATRQWLGERIAP